MKKCFSPYKKHLFLTLLFPLWIFFLFYISDKIDNNKLMVPIMFFSIMLIFPILMVIPNIVECPKCGQKLACGKENCMDWFGFERLDALFRIKCKKCEYDLTQCEE